MTDDYFDPGETVDRERLRALRLDALGDLIEYAHRELPFYRARWRDQRLPLGGPVDEESFRLLPLTRKRDLVEAVRAGGSMAAGIEAFAGFSPRNVVMTSGTMGFNTFAMVTDHDLDGASTLAQARELWMVGVRPGMRVLSISPAWHALGLFESRALTLIGAVPVMPWGTLTSRFSEDILNAVTRLQPEHLLMTARALRIMLSECDRLGLDSRRVFQSVRYVGCAGEALSSVFREYLRSRLEVEDVFERGGSSDGMFGGGECIAKRGHHVSADVHYVEVVDPRTGEALLEGRRGTAVVTNLTLGKSLYVRFDTEDVAEVIPGDCPCGRTHPVVEFYSRLADSVIVDERIVTPADVREVVDQVESTRFRPFSIASEGEKSLVVAVGGDAAGWSGSELEAVLAEQLGLRATVQAGETASVGWKEERITRRGPPS